MKFLFILNLIFFYVCRIDFDAQNHIYRVKLYILNKYLFIFSIFNYLKLLYIKIIKSEYPEIYKQSLEVSF